MMFSIGNLIKRFVGMPDARKSTIAQEDFMHKIDVILKDNGKTISNKEHRYLLDLFVNHEDDKIATFLKGL